MVVSGFFHCVFDIIQIEKQECVNTAAEVCRSFGGKCEFDIS